MINYRVKKLRLKSNATLDFSPRDLQLAYWGILQFLVQRIEISHLWFFEYPGQFPN